MMTLTLLETKVSKEMLFDLYWKQKKTLIEVGKTLSCSLRKVNYFMRKYKIQRRKAGPIKKEEKKLFCKSKDCKNEITTGSKSGYCKSCAVKERYKNYDERKKQSERMKVRDKSIYSHIKGKEHHSYTTGITLVKHYCVDCLEKDIFTEITCQAERCVDCARELHSRNFSGENHPNYIDGRSNEEYPKEFNDKLKEQIRERDNYTCQKCGMIEEEHKTLFNQVLLVHHIDFNKKNCKEENLTVLCCRCNSEVNYNREYWQKYFEEKMNNVFEFITN